MARTKKRKAEELSEAGPVASRTRSSTRQPASPATPPSELRPEKKRKTEPAETPTRRGKGKAEPSGTPTRKGRGKAEPAGTPTRKGKEKAEPAGNPTRRGKGKAGSAGTLTRKGKEKTEPAGTPTRKGEEKAEPAEKKAEAGEAAKRKGKGVVIDEGKNVASADVAARIIVIEHCKQGRPFKPRANEAKDGIELAVPGVTVLLNPDNEARKGCFEIREKDGEIFFSLLDVRRPYKEVEDLDMDEIIADIVKKMKP